jgi:hypothetical protein
MSSQEIDELRPKKGTGLGESVISYLYSALLWTGGSLFYLSTIPSKWWMFRDDSVIHLSQAKNFSLFGSIGLSAGDRVEAMSSPLNFAISWLVFAIKPDINYQTYLEVYLIFTLAALSASMNFFLRSALVNRISKNSKPYLAVNTFIFALAISSWTTFGWLISGMENILCVIFFLLFLAHIVRRKINLAWVIFSSILLGVCRIELAALIGPILLFASLRIEMPRKSRFYLVAIPVLTWILIHLARFAYYGHLLPNTATALNTNLSFPPLAFICLEYLIFLILQFKSESSLKYRGYLIKVILPFIIGVGLWRLHLSPYSFFYQTALIFAFLGILVLIILLIMVPQISWESQLLILVSIIPLNHFFLFGPARLSAFRIVGMFLIPIISLLAVLIYNQSSRFGMGTNRIILIIILLGAIPIVISKFDKPRNLCCSISPSEKYIYDVAGKVFSGPAEMKPIPIVANPDLGKVSFAKNVMNVDLGLIGDPLLSNFSRNSPEFVDDYLINIVAPDVIELHGHWNCSYSSVITSRKFNVEWKLSWSGFVSEEMNPSIDMPCPRVNKYSIWARNIPENERQLSEAIAVESFESYSQIIKEYLGVCNSQPYGCEFISRAIIRNKAHLIREGSLEKTVNLMAGLKSYEFNSLRILQPRKWDERAYRLAVGLIQESLNRP